MDKVGFIGLGTMGYPMAVNLIKAGYRVSAYNRTRARAERLAAEYGAAPSDSPAEAARGADAVISMLSADDAVKEVMLGDSGVIHGVSPGAVVIDSSTVSPRTSRQVAQAFAKAGAAFLDAPVTGSEPQAAAGKLTFMAGGPEEAFERCRPLFLAMGAGAHHMGPQGAGSQTKLANNTLASINLLGLSESLALAAKAGVDPELFLRVVAGGGARSAMAELKAPKMLARDFEPNFMVELMHKDLKLAQELAEELELPLPVLALAKEMMRMAMAKGFGKEDISAVVKCYEDWSGKSVAGTRP